MVSMGLAIPHLLRMPICRLPDSHQIQVVHPQGRRRKFRFHCDGALFLLVPSSSWSFDSNAGEEPAKGVSTRTTPSFLIELWYVFFFSRAKRKRWQHCSEPPVYGSALCREQAASVSKGIQTSRQPLFLSLLPVFGSKHKFTQRQSSATREST